MNLSKSRYCKGMQCPKILWLDQNMPELFDISVMNESVLRTGNTVGDVAMGYFGPFTEVPFSEDKTNMLDETRRLLDAGSEVITEAAFSIAYGFCIVDILRKVDDGYEMIEVKSSTASPSDGAESAKEVYLHDMAFQCYVLRQCGLPVKKIWLMRLNREYVRRGELDLQALFTLTDCTDVVFAMHGDVESNISAIREIAEQVNEPEADIGCRCDAPYPCGYKGWCYRNLPSPNVFDIGWSMWRSKKEAAYNAGLITFEDVLRGGVPLSEKQRRQVEHALQSQSPFVDRMAIQDFLAEIRYPLYFLDFETYMQAIPLWDFVSPYAQITFQYSLHIQDRSGGAVTHKEFLGKEGADPRRFLAEKLCVDIPQNACVMAYSMGFEKGRIHELANLFPDLGAHLMSLHENMLDLAKPFQSGAYYCREMGGSYSIKSVLPALIPNDPDLDYQSLDIQNGSMAMDAYASLHHQPPDVIAGTRAALLAYCRLDTLAMVKILEKLYESIGQ